MGQDRRVTLPEHPKHEKETVPNGSPFGPASLFSYIHYHKGGYPEIIMDGNHICLLSVHGEKLQIKLNKHISLI